MDENKKNELTQNQKNPKSYDSQQPIQSINEINKSPPKEKNTSKEKEENKNVEGEKEQEFSILKDIELIRDIKSNNYEDLIKKNNYVDFRTRDEKPWKIGLVSDILDDIYIIEDIKDGKIHQIKKDDFNKVSYFRKNSIPDNEENFYLKRDNEETLKKRLAILETLTKKDDDNIFNQSIWNIYYILHSKFFLGLDAAMKINTKSLRFMRGYLLEENNEGVKESFEMILCILLFLSEYYKYIGENIEEFIYYKNKIINTELEDLKVVNKKCAFFSFFDESCELLNKIFANVKHCLYWYTTFEDELKNIIPCFSNEDKKKEEEGEENMEDEDEYPQYEEEIKKRKNIDKKDVITLKKICLENAYKSITTFTTEGVKVRAIFVCYFIDYFNAINGFSNLAKIIYSSKSMDLQLLFDLINRFSYAKVLTNSYSKTLFDEKIKIFEYIDNIIENLDEKAISENKNEELMAIIKSAINMFFKNDQKILEKFNIHYISKNLISSKKLEQKITSLTNLNDILKKISENKSKKSNINVKEFCQYIREYKILNILYDNNIHEEIIKRLPDIIYAMYENNFGYENNEENIEKINSDKKLIFDLLFNKLLESEQNNERLVKNIQTIICDFCEILNDEDKLNIYNLVINYLEKSIEKKGIPMKEHLSFIIDYSLKAIKNENEEDEEEEEMKDEEKKHKQEVENFVDDYIYDEKIINEKLENNNYYGLNFLIKYLSEDNYKKYNMTNEQKIELINLSIKGIIKIIQTSDIQNQTLLLKNLCSKASLSIRSSKDILQYIILLDQLKSDVKLNKIFSKILEEYSLKGNFFSLLMSDMDRYLSLIIKNSEEQLKGKSNIKVYEGLFSNELNIKLRLNLIFFLLQKQNVTKENLEDFDNKIYNSCEKNNLASKVLNELLYSNIKNFSSEVIQFLYNKILNNDIKEEKLNDYQYYNFCTAIIKEINKIENHFYFMNGKDLAVINCENAKNIKGIELLWQFLIQTKDNNVRNEVNEFLADIFFGIKLDTKEKLENFWNDFVSNMYSKLEENIQKENYNNENGDENKKTKYSLSIQGIISLIKKIETKFMNKGEIIKDINQISKEIENVKEINAKNNIEEKYIKVLFSGNLYNTEKPLEYDMKIGSSEYFYMFRYKLSQFYKIPVNLINIVIDDVKYNNRLKSHEIFNNIKFDMYNDLESSYNAFTDLEEKINLVINNSISNPLILKVEVKKENDYFKFIKTIIKDYPKLMRLLKRKQSECLLDVWCLIREDELKINNNIIQMIKDIFNNKNEENINNIFNFSETNIYYISFILFHLNSVINDYNQLNEHFINDVFLRSEIWQKIQDIKIETSNNPHLGEIYEKNNVINFLLNIFKIISLKTNDENILVFILKKIFEFYYQTIDDCIHIDLKYLPSTEGFQADFVENLYISNTNTIKDIIVKNKIIYKKFLELLLLNKDKEENDIKNIFEFLFFDGLLKNKMYPLNLKLKSFILTIIDDKFFSFQDKKIINEFYSYIFNYFFSQERYYKLLNCIKEIASYENIDSCFNVDKYEKNIELYYDILNDVMNKIFPIISSFYSFDNYIRKIILPNIYNPIIKDVPNDVSYHEIILGGNFKILLNLLTKAKNYKDILDLKNEEEEKLKQYLFLEIILNKCNKRIFTKENINNYNSISISSSYTFKHAINIFIFLVMQNIQNEKEEKINYYFETITELHKENYWKGNSILDWKLEFKDNTKLTPFVGLKNLGCTCYMNSLLQVFFNFVPFRESILKCPCKEEKKNSLYQIKKVFYSLKYLQVNYYTPSDFPQNFDDEVLNVHLQMDVDEFFGNILDKIENRLKKTKNENLVKYFFQGSQNDILKFQDGCTHHRINVNNFYSIQLQVQNKKNIYESLDTLTEGELMNGDNCIFCPKCNKKIPAVKSQKFKTLPRMLIFVLKRFEFDYDTLKKVKINDYYEFPQELDMSKYLMKEENDIKGEKDDKNDMNKFILKSVVVHMGNTEQGHYYAFIRKEGDKWYQFNDTEVTPFDIKFLEEETFGGDEIFYTSGNKQVSQKNRSAYLLFYEKKNQNDCQEFDNIEAIDLFLKEKNISYLNNNEILKSKNENGLNIININEIDDTKYTSEIAEENDMKEILENLNNEMFKYFLNKKLFSNEYQYFILELFCNILNYYYSYDLPVFLLHLCRNNASNNENLREIQAIGSNLNNYINKDKIILFTKTTLNKNKEKTNSKIILNIFKYYIIYFFNVLIRSKDREYLGGMVDLFKFLINDQLECAVYLIEEFCNKNVIIEYLINCPSYEIKKLIVGILYCAMIKSVNGYEFTKIKKNNNQRFNTTKKLTKTQAKSLDEDEELARQIYSMEENDSNNLIYENPLDQEGIPQNILKMLYNMLHIIRTMGFSHLNEQRFLYFIIYRFSLINQNTKEFLIYKCRILEFLCLFMEKNCATKNYSQKEIMGTIFIGLYTVPHCILSKAKKEDENIIIDKGGVYRNENYIFMLYFYLLNHNLVSKKNGFTEDPGYSLENSDFVKVLLNNIRTKQDAFCFSNYINERCLNNKNKFNSILEALIQYLNRVDNNENTNYDYNNYTNLVDNDFNSNPNPGDPGMNPKFLLIIIKRFITNQNLKQDFVVKFIKYIFKVFDNNRNYYSFSIMLIDFLIEIFTLYLRKYIPQFQKEIMSLIDWIKQYPIPPKLYKIEDLALYKNQRKTYADDLDENVIKEFESKNYDLSQKKLEVLISIYKNDFKTGNEYEKDLDLSDFKFIIGDIIYYGEEEATVEEALDEMIKIKITGNNNTQNKKDKKANGKKVLWIETDSDKIRIKELKN